MRGMELVDIFLFVISLNGILLSTKSMFSLHFQEEFSIQDIIRFVQSDGSCEFFLQEMSSLIRQDNLRSHQNEETCILLTSFDNSSSNETIRLSGVVVRLYANVKKYEFSIMPNQCQGNSSFNEIQIHVSCQPTKAHNVNICDDGRGCNTEREFCRKLFEDENEKGLCIARRNLFESCDKDVQCTQTTKCENRTCHCKKGFKVIGGKCLPVGMSLNESCSHDGQCTGTVNAGRCQQNKQSRGGGVCSCDPGFFQEGSNCLQGNRRLFQSCESQRQCTGTHGAGVCKVIAGIQMCHCPDNHTVVKGVCMKVGSVIGDTCIINEECTGTQNGGRCIYSEDDGTRTQTCACNDDFLTNGSYCLPVNKKLFETCEVDDQCNGTLGLGICRTVGDRKVCVCGPQYIADMASLTCHKVGRQLLESCEYGLQCNGTTNATVCGLFGNRSLCFCNKGIVESNGKCTEEIIYRFMFVGAGGLLFGMFFWIVILVRKCRRNLLSRGGRSVVQSDQENINRQSTLYAVPSDIRNYVEPSTFLHQDTQRVANYTRNHLSEPVKKEDNAFSQQMFVEQDPCDDVYNHLHEKEAPLCQGVYDVAENVSKRMFQSSDDDPKSADLYDFAEPIDVSTL
ncbi:prion-like-(Q/N-rich) domain-bearing protein 25 isoform X2 [Ostrea edulis]|uniref:prion-like-(Q/N-rich) domain-bearing protein 25 isoform X2 n=1 Tax=Ostrea edulis TaxID=37623 RepID=UPI0024AEDAA1|nr:prion-like-(Q/N-rich) domain-bearing protein 25 isoform X2 [Ostrea edulis]